MLGAMSGVDIALQAVDAYFDLARMLHEGKLDLAWLAPVPFLSLALQSRVVPLAAIRGAPYQSALIVRADSALSGAKAVLRRRAGWVDPYSAAGFIVPRVQLARLGIDPRVSFSRETFYGSHDAVVDAVVSGACDFGATYAWKGRDEVLHGPWTATSAPVRVLAAFGSIPPDVIAARSDVDRDVRKSIVRGLKRMMMIDDARRVTADVFGSLGFCRPNMAAYEELRALVLGAYRKGLLDIADRPDPLDVAKTLEIRVPLPPMSPPPRPRGGR